MGVRDTPKTVMTTRATAVLRIGKNFISTWANEFRLLLKIKRGGRGNVREQVGGELAHNLAILPPPPSLLFVSLPYFIAAINSTTNNLTNPANY